MSTPVLATKLFAPARRPHLVARPRLAEQLDSTLETGHRLTLISAPAGFGKTTVMSDWLDDLGRRRAAPLVAWLSLDEGDNDLTRFVTHLVAALGETGLTLDSSMPGAVGAASSQGVLTVLLNNVSRAGTEAPGQHWVLVFDDFHTVASSEVHEAVAFLLDHLPSHLHVLLATRSDPPLHLARLRTRGQLTEVRAADLRFTAPEALDFLNRGMGLSLKASDVAALEERTEGWIAGLQLAALSLRGITEGDEVSAFVAAFTGSDRFVIDYLADEVLARQSQETREFLLATAVLVQLTGSLCDGLTGRADGAAKLEELERSNLFVVPLDTQRSWYRYHHLFADVLHARLVAEHPEQVRALHQRASAWFDARDQIEDAVRHALAAQDLEGAAYLMEKALPELRRTRQDAVLLAWAHSLPAPVVRRSPVLSLLSASSLLMSGDHDGVESRLDDADAALASGAEDPEVAARWAETDDLRTAPATIAVFRASLAQARGDVDGTVLHAQRAVDLAGPADHFLRGSGGGFLGLAAWASGDVHNALSTFGDAVRNLRAAGRLVDALDSTIVLADLHAAAGTPSRARRLYQGAVASATAAGEPYPRALADFHVGLAELDRERDDLHSAESQLEAARVLRERGSITENRHRWFTAMAQLRATRGEYDAAADLLREAQTLYRPGFYLAVRPIAAMLARIRIASGDLDGAGQWAHDEGVSLEDDPDYLHEYEHLTLVRLVLARHNSEHGAIDPRRKPSGHATLDSATSLLGRLHTAAADARRDGSLVEIRVLLALAHQADDDLPQALSALHRALDDGPEPDSYVRLYLDEGLPMVSLLQHALDASDTVNDALRPRLLLERMRSQPSPAALRPLADPLSARELEVLRLLDSELTGPEIARHLYVSLNTLRTHTKRIFTKLGANTRAAAVQRARERGLI